MEQIFIQIAAYRDAELLKTIENCISNASDPERLNFGIVNQYSLEDDFCFDVNRYENDSRFKILNIQFNQSLGACWARSETNKMYNHQDYVLQIDSHSRFVKNWDSKLISYWKNMEDDWAIFTSYPPPYHPLEVNEGKQEKVYIIHTYDIKNHMTKQRPMVMDNWRNRGKPYRARHVAAGFIFGKGKIIQDVPYDPELYFSGEETSLAIRYYTHGYNLYHPNEIFVWHYYTRKESPKHWRDNIARELMAKSRNRLMSLVGLNKEGQKNIGKFGLGGRRSLQDFIKYSGIDFERNFLHKDTLEAKEPPVSQDEESWSKTKKTIFKKIKWDISKVDDLEDVSFWAFFIKDANGNTFLRKDILKDKYPEVINKATNELILEISYYEPFQEPKSFVIWPFSKSKRWLKKSPHFIVEGDCIETIEKFSESEMGKSKKILIVGSGKSGLDVKKYESYFDEIVVVNNAWALTDKWKYWVHPNDYKGLKPDFIKSNQIEINANSYGKSLKKYGGIHECGFSIMLNASYWVLDNLKPNEIYYLGADMNYIPDEEGNTHFYGVGFDIKNKGISDPDLMVKMRSKGDPNYLINIYKRFESVANHNRCQTYNLSRDERTRLPYERKQLD